MTVRHEGARRVSHRTVTPWRKVTRNLLKLRGKMKVVCSSTSPDEEGIKTDRAVRVQHLDEVRAAALTKKGLRRPGHDRGFHLVRFEHQP